MTLSCTPSLAASWLFPRRGKGTTRTWPAGKGRCCTRTQLHSVSEDVAAPSKYNNAKLRCALLGLLWGRRAEEGRGPHVATPYRASYELRQLRSGGACEGKHAGGVVQPHE
eukprot:1160340-Pelagomonas_calceolata.AAC.7